ncbi:hypothetical protein [Bradyrhizobium sp. ORS 111]
MIDPIVIRGMYPAATASIMTTIDGNQASPEVDPVAADFFVSLPI